jgi:hypothetical protein
VGNRRFSAGFVQALCSFRLSSAALVIVRRRHVWSGCKWLFWSTIALGPTMSVIGLTGWATDELLTSKAT